MIKLGDQVKDKLTGFKGTAIARAEYLYGCIWVYVVPKKLHDNKPTEDVWFDEQRLDMVATKETKKRKRPKLYFRGGPTPSMPKMSVPRPYR